MKEEGGRGRDSRRKWEEAKKRGSGMGGKLLEFQLVEGEDEEEENKEEMRGRR